MKYIDTNLLREEIKRRIEILKKAELDWSKQGDTETSLYYSGKSVALDEFNDFINSLPEEKPSEDLEEAVSEDICIAADKHIKRVVDAAGHPGWDWSTQDIADAFKAGAQWMKDQLTVK